MDEYESLSHSKWECKYHIVFMPKVTVAHEPTQHARAHLLLHGGDIVNAEHHHLGAANRPVTGGDQHAVDDAEVEVQIRRWAARFTTASIRRRLI